MKDLLKEIASVFVIGGGLAWDYAKQFWKKRTSAQQSVLIAVAIIVVSMGFVQCVRAENAPDSNFGYISTDGSVVFACYVSDENTKPEPGTVHTCLVLQAVGPDTWANTGAVSFCTMTGDKSYTCGEYEDMRRLSTGI